MPNNSSSRRDKDRKKKDKDKKQKKDPIPLHKEDDASKLDKNASSEDKASTDSLSLSPSLLTGTRGTPEIAESSSGRTNPDLEDEPNSDEYLVREGKDSSLPLSGTAKLTLDLSQVRDFLAEPTSLEEWLKRSTPLFFPQVLTRKDITSKLSLYIIVPIADTARTKAHTARIYLSLFITGTNE